MKYAKLASKIPAVLVTVATFGLITPQTLLAESPNEDKHPKRDLYHPNEPPIEEHPYEDEDEEEERSEREQFVQDMVKYAEENSYLKFGI